MRLIDADKLKQKDMNGDVVDIFGVLEAPTVEAIPIEWLEKRVDMLKERNYHSYQVLMPALIEMLQAWRKENDQTR